MRFEYRINQWDQDAECCRGYRLLCLIRSRDGEFRSGHEILPYYNLHEETITTANNSSDRLNTLIIITSLVLL